MGGLLLGRRISGRPLPLDLLRRVRPWYDRPPVGGLSEGHIPIKLLVDHSKVQGLGHPEQVSCSPRQSERGCNSFIYALAIIQSTSVISGYD